MKLPSGTTNLNAFGAFDFKFKLPDNANLGYTRIDLSTASSLQGSTYNHAFQIQEFRRPEFEVTAKNETEAPYFIKQSANVSVEAKYFAGGGLANAETNWTVTSNADELYAAESWRFYFRNVVSMVATSRRKL
ncbi:MAG: hypothetical protein WKF71_07770 [Pyrinomonadaceae bacterium]